MHVTEKLEISAIMLIQPQMVMARYSDVST